MSIERAHGSQAPRRRLLLRLYVAGHAPNSAAALTNLQALLPTGETGGGPVELEVVDVLRDPARALAEGIMVSPTLVRLSPLPVVRIVGSLSDRETVRLALGLGE
jgi:circadian clock protein KaiB